MRLLTLVFLLCTAARGDWEGKVRFTHDPPRKRGGSEGAIHVSRGRVRLEQPTPAGDTVILSTGGKLYALFPAKKQSLEMGADQAALATVPPVSLKGMKQIGEESIDGVMCAIWERDIQTAGGRIRQRLWVPPGHRQLIFLREVTATDRGATRADISEIREVPQRESLFRVPSDYRK